MMEIREFSDDPVYADTKRAILGAGRLAPSGRNLQHLAFVLVDAQTDLDRLASHSPTSEWVADAAFAVVICTDPEYEYHEIDAGRAVTHMQLAAWDAGVGSCIYTGFDPAVREFLEIPDSLTPTLAAGFGQPPRPRETVVGETDRKSPATVVHHGRYGTSLDV